MPTYHDKSGKFCPPESAASVTKDGERYKVVRQHRRVGSRRKSLRDRATEAVQRRFQLQRLALLGALTGRGWVNIREAFDSAIEPVEEGRGFPIGTKRERKDGTYIKTGRGWVKIGTRTSRKSSTPKGAPKKSAKPKKSAEPKELTPTPGEKKSLDLKWKKLPPPPGKPFETVGYEVDTPMGKATLTKEKIGRKTTWMMKVGDKSIDLGKKADFDHAEGELLKLHRQESLREGHEKPLTPREKADIKKANVFLMDVEVEGGRLPPKIQRLNDLRRRLKPSEKRAIIDYVYRTAPGSFW